MRTTAFGLIALVGFLGCSSQSVDGSSSDPQTPGAPSTGTTDGTAVSTSPTEPAGKTTTPDPSDPATPPGPVVSGLAITDIAIYQGVKVAVVKAGSWLSSTNAPIVAGRAAMMRLYVKPDASFQGESVTAELRLVDGQKKLPVVHDTKTITKASLEGDLSTTFNLDIPADSIPHGVTFQVSLTAKDGTVVTGSSDARFPKDGTARALGAQTSGKVKVVIVPVQYMADGSGRTPDVSQTQLDLYKKTMMALYPATDVVVTARAPWSYTTAIGANGSGFSQVLNAVTQLRRQDGVADDVYYYGALAPKTTFSTFCGGGCVTGLSTVADVSTPNFRASVGIGYSGTDSAETMVHEVGHAHGREHAPCGGTSGVDAQFPYSDGGLGVAGYDILAKTLMPTSKYHDMMGYCPPSWVSDYTFAALFDRIQSVDQSTGAAFAAGASNASSSATYRTAIVEPDGSISWSDEVRLAREPAGGAPRSVSFLSATGVQMGTHTARFYPYDHLAGGMLLVPTGPTTKLTATLWSSVKIQGYANALAR